MLNYTVKKYVCLYKIWMVFLYAMLYFVVTEKANAQSISNEGTDFWLCFPAHTPALDRNNNPLLATMSVFITSKYNSAGKVACGNWTETFTVQANQVTEIEVPRDVSYIDNGNGIRTAKGIRVTVEEDMPGIVVYAHVFAGSRSAATLALPLAALGQKYHAVAYTQQPAGSGLYFSQFNVVAADTGTTVRITPPGKPPFSVVLTNPGDVYQYQDTEDVSGTLIEADPVLSPCKRIAVFSGSTAVSIKPQGCTPGNNDTYDPLFQQLYPLESWGKIYALIPFYGRRTGSIYRVLASENNTQVNMQGVTVNLNAGEYYTTSPVYQVSELNSNKPVMVTQYALTQYCADPVNQSQSGAVPGDPDMVVLNPVEYGIRDVTLYSSGKLAITEQYINVAMPASRVSSFTINGVGHGGSFLTIPGGNGLAYAQIDLRRIEGHDFSLAADTGFNAIAYGFGPIESYAYSAGTNLAAVTLANALKKGTDIAVRTACLSDAFDFQLLLPYQAQKLSWRLEASGENIDVAHPVVYRTREVAGRTLYEYRLFSGISFADAGIKQLSVRVTPDNSFTTCFSGAEETVRFDLEIGDLPKPDFQLPEKSCTGSPVLFLYKEEGLEEQAGSWLWDFGDGTYSSDRDPVHVYSAIGIYSVKLSVKGNNGCFAEVLQKELEITAPPMPDILSDIQACKGQNFQLLGQSNGEEQGDEEWEWDFGNGDTLKGKEVTYAFAAAGNYKINLRMTTSSGCRAVMAEKEITVVDFPVANIDIPVVSCTGAEVVFKDSVSASGGVTDWRWDFGDGNFSEVREPIHIYTQEGIYTVSLMLRNTSGCWSAKVFRDIHIMALPDAGIVVADSSCLDQPVLFGADYAIGTVATGWEWDFGDGSFSREEKPVHRYTVPGAYIVKLQVSNAEGCISQVVERKVVVRQMPLTGFNISGSRCTGVEVVFENNSTAISDAILSYEWDFGDGSPFFQGKEASHLYAHPGVYKVRLKVVTEAGCSFTEEQDLSIAEKLELQ